uniref:rRNA N-glycosylase n=1 Tax=Hordeum vulgare subsp. vulgare TaxID=112509 RepID=F2EDI0_HORVV|nr:predicted protein [Hordeum vulgare subsp. vulgare]
MAALLLFLLLALAASNSKHGGAVAAADDPPALRILTLRGSPENTSLAVQAYDLSLAGFTDESLHWHAFPGHEHLIPTSMPLPFGSSYGELIGGLANVPSLPLGRDAMLQAVRVLSAYDPAGDVEPVKRALAAVKVMICESGRLKPIRKTVNDGWDGESRVAPEHLPYIEHWDTMSYEIIRSNRTGKWDGPFTQMLETKANIRSKEEAVAVMNMLMDADFGQVFKAHAIPINLD